MDSIEERVKNLVDWILRRDGCLKYVGLAELLEKEFKDQKAIYDKAMDMLNEACDNTITVLKDEHKREMNELIDKACRLWCSGCEYDINGDCCATDRCGHYLDFRKQLEE